MCFAFWGNDLSGSNLGTSFTLLLSPPHTNAPRVWVAGLAPLQLQRAASQFHFLLPDGFVLVFLSLYLVHSQNTCLGFRLFPLRWSSAAPAARVKKW